jgi:hypothetical protein
MRRSWEILRFKDLRQHSALCIAWIQIQFPQRIDIEPFTNSSNLLQLDVADNIDQHGLTIATNHADHDALDGLISVLLEKYDHVVTRFFSHRNHPRPTGLIKI